MESPNDKSMLLGLPLELLNEITDSLAEDALLALHLTCKALENCSERSHCAKLSCSSALLRV